MRPRALLLLLLLAVLAACVPRHREPVTGARLAATTESFIDDGPFRIVFAGPKGETPSLREVTLAFSRPRRALGVLDDADAGAMARPPARVVRADDASEVLGSWRWFGERTAVFWPEGGFENATAYRVEIDPAFQAAGGALLGPTPPFTFVGPRPQLTAVTYGFDEFDRHMVTLAFDQPVQAAEIERSIRLEGKGAKGVEPIPFQVVDVGEVTEAHLHADRRIARLDDVTAVAAPTLVGTQGPLPSGREVRLAVPEVGAFRATVGCYDDDGEKQRTARAGSALRCLPQRSDVSIHLTKAVLTRELARRLIVSPAPRALRLGDGESTDEVQLSQLMDLLPGHDYRVIVKAGLVALDKETLPADQVFDVHIEDLPPSIGWRDLAGPAVVESARPFVNLALETMNVPAFDALRAPLDDDALFDTLLGKPGTMNAARLRALPGSVVSRLEVSRTRNTSHAARFDLPPAMRRPGASGVFAVATSAPDLGDDVRLLSVTDLGITAKWSPHGGLVWIRRLSTGGPVAHAAISLVRAYPPAGEGGPVARSVAFTTETDQDGLAILPSQVAATFLDAESTHAEAVLFARDGDDRAFARLPSLDTSLSGAVGEVFTERAIYRPGDTAYVKGVFRAPTPAGLVSLVGRPITVEAIDEEERVLFAGVASLDAFGSFACEIPIPRTTRLGFASVRARLGTPSPGAPRHAPRQARHRWNDGWDASRRFLVDELRTVDFTTSVESDRPTYLRGEKARITAHGAYLIGAPMHEVPVSIHARREPATFRPDGLESFNTDTYTLAHWPDMAPFPGFDGELGDDGSLRMPLDLALPDQTGPERIMVDASIEDVSRSFAAGGDTSFLVHPGAQYLGLRIPIPAVHVGQSVRAEVVASDIDGKRHPGVDVRVTLYESDKDGKPVETSTRCDVRTDVEVVACDLRVTRTGAAWLRAKAVDTKGRPIAAATGFAVPSGEPPRPSPPSLPRPAPPKRAPELSFDDACRASPSLTNDGRPLLVEGADRWDQTFMVGQHAHLCLRGDGDSLFTIEREGILHHELRRLGAIGTLTDLPIAEDHPPGVELGIHSVHGRSGPFPTATRPRPDSGRPFSSRGGGRLRVLAPERKLSVSIETPPELRPGEQLTARVVVRDGAGRPAPSQVTLWAVDEGILNLRPYQVPQLDELFELERGTDVRDVETRDALFFENVGSGHHVKPPSLRSGSTSVNARMAPGRAVFRATAFFLPSVLTGLDGVASVKVKLPDNLTSWKVFAVAMMLGDGFGSGEASFQTRKTLMARPSLPRFLRVGDRLDGTVIVDSLAAQALDVKVSMQASGTLTTPGASREIALVVPPHGHVPVRFPLDAKAAGHGTVTFRVASVHDALEDQVTVDENVSSAATLETVVIDGETRARVDEPLGDLTRARSDVGGLELRLSSSPIVGLAESLEDLVEYPYGCTEQLTSRLVPLVRLRALARSLGVALPRDVDGAVRASLASLLSHQRTDGGFGFWPQSKHSEPWLTIGALSALESARAAGYVVAPEPVERALGYLDGEKLDVTARALREDLFASAGAGDGVLRGGPRARELRALAAEIDADPTVPLFARALTAHALVQVDRDAARHLLDGLASRVRVTGATATIAEDASVGWRSDLSSSARSTAMVLRAFLAVDPHGALVPKLVHGLMAMRKNGRWGTTQASAWALIALDEARALFAAGGAPSTVRVALDGRELQRAILGPNGASTTATLPMAQLLAAPGASLSFTTEGGPLFFEGTLRYARREAKASALKHGIHVTRTMKVATRGGSARGPDDYRVGDYVTVDVQLASPVAQELVVLDDPFPAGFEAVNQAYADADRQAFFVDSNGNVTHRELRDDRVVTFFDRLPEGEQHTQYLLRVTAGGDFTLPPARAECMYAPDVFGRTASETVHVRP